MGVVMWSDGKMDLGVFRFFCSFIFIFSDRLKNGLAMKIKHIALDKNRMLSESYFPEASEKIAFSAFIYQQMHWFV